MKWLKDKADDGGVAVNDATVFGGWWQWGRKDWEHAVNIAVTPHIRYVATAQNADHGQVSDITAVGTVYWKPIVPPFGVWYVGTTPEPNALWGNGRAITSYPRKIISTGVIEYSNLVTPSGSYNYLDDGGNPYTVSGFTRYFQQPKKTEYDPCPTGWRVPTQDEWETLGAYCQSSAVVSGSTGGDFSTSATNPQPVHATNNPDLIWVPVVKGLPSTGWSTAIGHNPAALLPVTNVGGYAIYKTAEWVAYRDANSAWATTALYETTVGAVPIPEPLLFFPAAGSRASNDARAVVVGKEGFYWSSTIAGAGNNSVNAYILYFSNATVLPNESMTRATGCAIRCVVE
jgi:hypothetical protein